MKKTLIGATIILILLATLATGCLKTSGDEIEEETIDYTTPRTNTEAGIDISVTYLPEVTDATAFSIKVTAHKDYNDNFEENSYLIDSKGKTYKPLSYEGTTGHHASGTLTFPKIKSKGFKLVIQNVAGVQERVFEW